MSTLALFAGVLRFVQHAIAVRVSNWSEFTQYQFAKIRAFFMQERILASTAG
jgi:hypothetical protein